MRTRIALTAALLALPAYAFASSGGEGNNTNCNGVGNPNSPCVPSTNPGGGNSGGPVYVRQQARATAVAASRSNSIAVARGGSATASGGQGGAGGAGGSVVVNNALSGGAGGSGTGDNVRVTYGNARQPGGLALGFMAPPQCGAAFSGGGANYQGTGVLGFSWETESCRKHRLATALANMGRTDAAIALLCTMDEIRDAVALTGSPCPSAAAAPQQVVATPVTAPAVPARNRPAYCNTPGIQNSECLQ